MFLIIETCANFLFQSTSDFVINSLALPRINKVDKKCESAEFLATKLIGRIIDSLELVFRAIFNGL